MLHKSVFSITNFDTIPQKMQHFGFKMFLSIEKSGWDQNLKTRNMKRNSDSAILFVQPRTKYTHSGLRFSTMNWEWQQENPKLTSGTKCKATVSRPSTPSSKAKKFFPLPWQPPPPTVLACLDIYSIFSFVLATASYHKAFPHTAIPQSRPHAISCHLPHWQAWSRLLGLLKSISICRYTGLLISVSPVINRVTAWQIMPSIYVLAKSLCIREHFFLPPFLSSSLSISLFFSFLEIEGWRHLTGWVGMPSPLRWWSAVNRGAVIEVLTRCRGSIFNTVHSRARLWSNSTVKCVERV